MFEFAEFSPTTTNRHVLRKGTRALLIRKGKRERTIAQPLYIFIRTDGTITIQAKRKAETFNFPAGEWEIVRVLD